MQPEDLQARWNAQGEEIFAAVAQWRAAHPKATLAEIEHAVDEQMYRLRARMIEQAAQASAAAESEASQGLVCEQCRQPLQARGRAKRRWQTHGGQEVEMERTAARVREGGGHLPATWEDGILHRLKHEGPTRVLRHLSRIARRYPQIQGQVTYLQKRRDLMDYPTYRASGWPIGSGSVGEWGE